MPVRPAVCLLLLGIASGMPSPPAPFEFHSFDIRGAHATQPRGINSSGWVVGTYTARADGPSHAFLRDPRGRVTLIDVPGAVVTVAMGIDDVGRVVGYWSPDATESVRHGFVRDRAGTIASFDAPGYSSTAASATNNPGGMALNLLLEPGPSRPYYRDPSGANHPLDAAGLTAATVHGLNDAGQVVGQAVKDGRTRAFVASVAPATAAEFLDYPGGSSTSANGIDDAGVIAGSWTSGEAYVQVTHGFVRDAEGSWLAVDYPGAVATSVTGISNAGSVTGWHTDSAGVQHGFLAVPRAMAQAPDLVTIDVPGAERTAARAINTAGEICGTYDRASLGDTHSFFRDAAGNLTLFDAPGSAITVVLGINDLGQCVGYWSADINANRTHAFVRQRSGEIVSFDAGSDFSAAMGINDSGAMAMNALTQPGPNRPLRRDPSGAYSDIQVGGSDSVYTTGLNQAGDLTGYLYLDNVQKAFVVRPDGSSLVFAAPLATTATSANGINDAGVVAGYYTTGYRGASVSHGLVRFPNGEVQTIDVPGADATLAFGINDAGRVVGYYDDAEGRQHGFVMALSPQRWPITSVTHRR